MNFNWGLFKTSYMYIWDIRVAVESRYAFKIQVRNPKFQADGGQWAMDFVDFGGRPFGSFLLRTFDFEATELFLSSPLIIQPFLQSIEEQYMKFRCSRARLHALASL